MWNESDGHTCLESKKRKKISNCDFQCILSYNVIDSNSAEFVIHVWSGSYDYSPLLQRLGLLKRLGFNEFENCKHTGYKCMYQSLGEINRNDPRREFNNSIFYEKFRKFANNIQEIFNKMRELDKILYDAGIKLPYENLSIGKTQLTVKDEKLYVEGEHYDIYKDIRNIVKQAGNEVFIIDAYPDEKLYELYIDEIPKNVKIKFLTNKPQGKFESVTKLKQQNKSIVLEVKKHNKIHDRVIIVDNKCWIIGTSIKDAGKKPTYLIKFNNRDGMYTLYDSYFQKGVLL